MMNHQQFLNFVIDDGIEAARGDYSKPSQKQKLEGSIKGFEECRNLSPTELRELLTQAHKDTMTKYREEASDYWYWRCREAEIGWVCNVVSVVLANNGLPTIVPPTARGVLKAAEIVGIRYS